jgi:heat shock protein HtpX
MKNAAKTAALLAGLGGLFIVLGGVFGGKSGLIVGLVIGLLFVGFSYWFSDKIAIKSARGVEVSPQQAPGYHQIVGELAGKAHPQAAAVHRTERPAQCLRHGPQPAPRRRLRQPGAAAADVLG